MAGSSTLLICPGCKVCQPCLSTALGHINEDGIEVRQRRRECTDCGHEFFTAEVPYRDLEKLLHERRSLRKRRKRTQRAIIAAFDNVVPFPDPEMRRD